MNEEEQGRGATSKKEIEDFIRQEVEEQTRKILKKNPIQRHEMVGLLKTSPENLKDSDEKQEISLLLDDFDNINSKQIDDNVKKTKDSLDDIRSEKLKEDLRRFQNYEKRAARRSNIRPNYVEGRRHRNELYCCYGIYFFIVFCVFLLALLYVWLPIIKGIKYGKSTTQSNNNNLN